VVPWFGGGCPRTHGGVLQTPRTFEGTGYGVPWFGGGFLDRMGGVVDMQHVGRDPLPYLVSLLAAFAGGREGGPRGSGACRARGDGAGGWGMEEER